MEKKVLDILTEERLIELGFTAGTVFFKDGCRLCFRNYATKKNPHWGVFVDKHMDMSLKLENEKDLESLLEKYK